MFKNLFTTNALTPKTTTVTPRSSGNNFWDYLAKNELYELNNGFYDQLEIIIKSDKFVLQDFKPKNPQAQINIRGGKDLLIQNCKAGFITASTEQTVKVQNSKIIFGNFPTAKQMRLQDIEEVMTFTCPEATSLEIKYAHAQLGADIPKLAHIQGDYALGFAAPYSKNAEQHAKKIGGLYIAPHLTNFGAFSNLCVYNSSTENFVLGYENIAMSKNETGVKNIVAVKEALLESADFINAEQRNIGNKTLSKFVDTVLAIENNRQKKAGTAVTQLMYAV